MSNDNDAEALGNFEFSTTITVNPLSRTNVLGLPNLISGAGPDSGITERSTCPVKELERINTVIRNTFLSIPIFMSLVMISFFILLLFYFVHHPEGSLGLIFD